MASETIRDKRGFVVGTIEQTSNTTWVAKDTYGVMLGEYDQSLDRTMDTYGIMVSRGNSLMSLLFRGRV